MLNSGVAESGCNVNRICLVYRIPPVHGVVERIGEAGVKGLLQ